jgi:hypothetical protein
MKPNLIEGNFLPLNQNFSLIFPKKDFFSFPFSLSFSLFLSLFLFLFSLSLSLSSEIRETGPIQLNFCDPKILAKVSLIVFGEFSLKRKSGRFFSLSTMDGAFQKVRRVWRVS